MSKSLPVTFNKLYSELAEWWPLFSASADYEAEAEVWRQFLEEFGEEQAYSAHARERLEALAAL